VKVQWHRFLALCAVVGVALVECKRTLTPTEAPTLVPIEGLTEEPTEEPRPEGRSAGVCLGDTWTRSADGMVMVYVPGRLIAHFQCQGTEGRHPSGSEQLS
jgi:hypothetical protein